jgi:hypothetical protein
MIASCQAKMKQIRHEKKRPSPASTAMPTLSVVRPFTELMSSVTMFVRIPGALFLLSNQPMFFLRIAANNLTRRVNVKFSPPRPKKYFCRYVERPIPKQRITKYIVIIFLW